MIDIERLRELAGKATPGEWRLCHHLKSEEHDKACSCGYRGGIGGPDGEHMICEMGSTSIPGQECLEMPRYERSQEIANAQFITGTDPTTILALLDRLEAAERDREEAIVHANRLGAGVRKAEENGFGQDIPHEDDSWIDDLSDAYRRLTHWRAKRRQAKESSQ